MDDNFFSIIIPTYNQGNFLEKCINSCLNQTYKNFEIVIIDNNSTDITQDILKKYENKIIFQKIDNDGIISKSRNAALKIAKGNWLALLDSDDYFSPTKLEEANKAIKQKSFDVFSNSEWIIDENDTKSKIWAYGNKSKNYYKDLIKFGNSLSTSSSIIKKDFLLKNSINFSENREIRNIADYDFFLNIAKKGGKFFFYQKPLGYHLMHQESTSFKARNTHLDALHKLLNNHLDLNYIDKKEYNFSILNINTLDLIGTNEFSIYSKLIKLFKTFLRSPIDVSLISCRILNKFVKNKFLNLIY
tara:strand:- start:1117 stop:2022 length:906 start_codon:yes stop_codon:yes gene_type:complete